MPISQKFKDIIAQSVKDKNLKPVLDELKAKPFESRITTSYLVIKELKKNNAPAEYLQQVRPTREDLAKYKAKRSEVKKEEVRINAQPLFKFIFDNEDKDIIHKLIFVLLNTGRRTIEILESEVGKGSKPHQIKIAIRKQRRGARELVDINLLDGKQAKTLGYIKDIRDAKINRNSVATQVKRRLSKFGITAHVLRALYIELFILLVKMSGDTRARGQIFKDELKHKQNQNHHYDYIILTHPITNPFSETNKPYNQMTCRELRSEAKRRGLRGYSKMKKADLIQLLS
jgi:hypothetical protein